MKMHNKGRISVPKAVRTEMAISDGSGIAFVEWKQGTFIIEKYLKPVEGYRPFQI